VRWRRGRAEERVKVRFQIGGKCGWESGDKKFYKKMSQYASAIISDAYFKILI